MGDRALDEKELIISTLLADREREDPLRHWHPTNKQRPFIEAVLSGKKPENWFIAANRSGKSDAGAYCGAHFARFGDGDGSTYYGKGVEVTSYATSGWVISLDFPVSRDIIQPKYFDNGFIPPNATHDPFIPEREIESWRANDQVLRLKNGSIIGFKSADSGRKKFQGAEKDWVHIDEEPAKSIYEETVIRVGGDRALKIFGTCTLLPPEGQVGGVTWVYTDIAKLQIDGKLPHVGLYGASIYDNPHIPVEEIRRLEAIYPEGTILRRIRLNGEMLPGMSGSRAYSPFISSIHVRPAPFINIRRPLIWTWDFNVEPMVSLVGQKVGRVFWIFKELVLEEGNISEMCQLFRQSFPRHGAEVWVHGDATGKRRTGQTGRSDYQLLMNEMRTFGAPVKLRVPESNPIVPDRVNAVNRLLKDEQGEVRLLVDPSCTELISDMEQVLRDARGGIKKTYNRKDPYFRRTHLSDALGYWIVYDEPVRAVSMVPNQLMRIKSPGYAWSQSDSTTPPR